jgi:hypothetical protein
LFSQLSFSFLEPLGINQNSKAKQVMLEEFIKGKKFDSNQTLKRSNEEEDILNEIKEKLKENYDWNENTSFARMAGQNCSDMIVHVGESCFIF